MAEDGFHMPPLEGEVAKCSRPGCGQYIQNGNAVLSITKHSYCNQECLDIYYRKIGIYDLVYKNSNNNSDDR